MSYLLNGLKNRSPAAPSATPPKGQGVDRNATRSATAPTPKTLGPREA